MKIGVVTFPGSNFNINTNVVPVATLVSTAGEIAVDTFSPAVQVQTFNSTGMPADVDSALVVFDSSPSGWEARPASARCAVTRPVPHPTSRQRPGPCPMSDTSSSSVLRVHSDDSRTSPSYQSARPS